MILRPRCNISAFGVYTLVEHKTGKDVNEALQFEFAACSHVGRRENNEDSYGTHTGEGSFAAVVADGVGGHERGEEASRLAVNHILTEISSCDADEDLLLDAITGASLAIGQGESHGFTTVTALWISQAEAIAAHVGDSRIYQFRGGKILYQSLDHSDVMMGVLAGELPPHATRTHPARNRIFRALGLPGEVPKVDSRVLDVRPGDRFLLCSDGFWEPVWEEDMLGTMAQTLTAEEWLDRMRVLVEALDDPIQDNYTAVAIIVK